MNANERDTAGEQAFEQQLEHIGEHLRVAPGPRFYARLAQAPWKGVPGMVTERKAPARKWAWGVVELAVVLLALGAWWVLGGGAWVRGLAPGAAPTELPTPVGTFVGVVEPGRTATPLPGEGTGVETVFGPVTPTPTAAPTDLLGAVAGQGTPTFTPEPTNTPLAVDFIENAKVLLMRPSNGELLGVYPSLAELKAKFAWQAAGAVLFYALGEGESAESVAVALGLAVESITLSNPTLRPPRPGDQVQVPPVDGVVYHVRAGDTVEDLAAYYQVSVADIVNYAPNGLNGDPLSLKRTQLIVVPGGRPTVASFIMPMISREQVGKASDDPGACSGQFSGPVGDNTFVSPVGAHPLALTGEGYRPVSHPGLDIAAAEGAPVYAVQAGVVVFAGWNEGGYGNLVIVDHGNGWQSLYAHLSTVGVSCGQGVQQGGPIATSGSTGNTSGPALHFELIVVGQGQVNPAGYLP